MIDHDDVMKKARALVPVIRDRARETEVLRRVPDETIGDLQEAGLFKVLQPASYGGYEADLTTYFDVVLTLSAADGSVGWVYSVLCAQTWALALLDPLAAKDVWGTDPSTLISSATAPRSGYIDKIADGYRIEGQFGFSSGCHHGSWVFVNGMVRNAPEEGLMCFLVARGNYEIIDNWNVMGLCGTGSCDVLVDAIVPSHRVHSVLKAGSLLSDSPIYNVPYLKVLPHAATVPMVGMAQGALDEYVTLQKGRRRLFGRASVTSEPSSQIGVAESAAELDVARITLLRNFVDITEAAATGSPIGADLLARVDRDQVFATRYAVSAVDRIFAKAGARALSLENPLQRAWRDVHAGAAHPSSLPETKLAAYGALAFGAETDAP